MIYILLHKVLHLKIHNGVELVSRYDIAIEVCFSISAKDGSECLHLSQRFELGLLEFSFLSPPVALTVKLHQFWVHTADFVLQIGFLLQ